MLTPLSHTRIRRTSSLSHTVSYDPAKLRAQLRGKPSRATAFNAQTKTGLLPSDHAPRNIEGSTTYVVRGSGTIGAATNGRTTVIAPGRLGAAALASGNGSGGYIPGLREGPTVQMARDQILKEKREREERRRREKEVMEQDEGKTLGGEYIIKAREARLEQEARRLKEKERAKVARGAKGGDRQQIQALVVEDKSKREVVVEEEGDEDDGKRRKRAFNPAAVRLIGYDPTGGGDEDKETKRRRVSTPFLLHYLSGVA